MMEERIKELENENIELRKELDNSKVLINKLQELLEERELTIAGMCLGA